MPFSILLPSVVLNCFRWVTFWYHHRVRVRWMLTQRTESHTRRFESSSLQRNFQQFGWILSYPLCGTFWPLFTKHNHMTVIRFAFKMYTVQYKTNKQQEFQPNSSESRSDLHQGHGEKRKLANHIIYSLPPRFASVFLRGKTNLYLVMVLLLRLPSIHVSSPPPSGYCYPRSAPNHPTLYRCRPGPLRDVPILFFRECCQNLPN